MSSRIAILLQNLDLPSINTGVTFENFVTHYFNEIENCNSYKRFGKNGQEQFGLDVFSISKRTVIQCKVKNKFGRNTKAIRTKLIKELKSDFKKFQIYCSENNLSFKRFIFASTFDADTIISTECSKLSTKDIVVEYWSWDDFKSQMPDNTFGSYFKELIPFIPNNVVSDDYASTDEYQHTSRFKFNKADSLINQLFDYFQYLFSEVNNLPIQLLKDKYPFVKSDNCYASYSQFTLAIDNDELFELFDSIKILNEKIIIKNHKFRNGVIFPSKKLKYVLEKLTDQLVFNIENKKSHKIIDIRYAQRKYLSSARDSFAKLEYEVAIRGLNKRPRRIEDKMALAYMEYELGNFIKAAKSFEVIANISKEKHQLIRSAIAHFNLSKLYVIIKNTYYDDHSKPHLLERLKQIEIDKIYLDSKNDENKKLLDWILNLRFYTSKREDIYRIVNKIKDHYYSQLKGGWSSNNYVWTLINDFVQYNTFINENFIVFDKFSEHEEIVGNFIEGLIISHAINENQGSRLEYFDDWLFSIIIFYGNAEKVLKHLNRYKLTSLKYNSTSISGDSFLEIAKNHLTKYQNIKVAFDNTCEKSNINFWQKHESIFNNLMVLISFSEIELSQIRVIAKDLLNYLNETAFTNYNSIKYISLFIKQKGKLMDEIDLYGFLDLFINNGRFHENEFIESVIQQIEINHESLVINRTDLNKIFVIAFEKCTECNRTHSPEFIAFFHYAVKKENKKIIKDRIENELDRKFNSRLYYKSVIFNVFDRDDHFFDLYVKSMKVKRPSLKSIFSGANENRFFDINDLLNLCFKLGVDLAQSKFDYFRELDDYYLWLFDLENFDYDKFDPRWATEYPTVHYYNEFKKYPIIKEKALEFLKSKDNYLLEKLIIALN